MLGLLPHARRGVRRDAFRRGCVIKLGWTAGTEQYPPAELLDYAIAGDNAGFDLLEVSDLFNPWSEAVQASFAWTWLRAAAARTSRIVLSTGLSVPILQY